MSAKWLKKALNHEWLRDPQNRNENGSIRDGAICPTCHQPRPGTSFYYKKENVYVSMCVGCRRKNSGW